MQITTEYPVIIRFILINQALNKSRQCHRVERALHSKFICLCATNKCFVLEGLSMCWASSSSRGIRGPCWSWDAPKGPLTNGIGSLGALGGAREMPLRGSSSSCNGKVVLEFHLSVTSLNEC